MLMLFNNFGVTISFTWIDSRMFLDDILFRPTSWLFTGNLKDGSAPVLLRYTLDLMIGIMNCLSLFIIGCSGFRSRTSFILKCL